MSKNKKSNQTKKNIDKPKKKINVILIIGVIVLLVPIIALAVVVIGTSEKTGEPAVGDRFTNQLNPAISEEQKTVVKNAINFTENESVNVYLESATFKVFINVKDNTSLERIKEIAAQTYAKINTVLPIDTYFQNKDKTKMYDLEIHVYNFMVNQTQESGQIYVVESKTAAGTTPVVDVRTAPKNAEETNKLINPPKTKGQ